MFRIRSWTKVRSGAAGHDGFESNNWGLCSRLWVSEPNEITRLNILTDLRLRSRQETHYELLCQISSVTVQTVHLNNTCDVLSAVGSMLQHRLFMNTWWLSTSVFCCSASSLCQSPTSASFSSSTSTPRSVFVLYRQTWTRYLEVTASMWDTW